MINLLPADVKKDIAYARKNKVLVSWIVILWVSLLLMSLVMAFGMFFINMRANNLNRLVTVSEQRVKDQNLQQYQKKAETFSKDLNTAVKLLESQLLFSKIIKAIGSVLPPGVTLGTLDYASDEEILTLNVTGTSQKDITVAFENIRSSQDKSNNLFGKADLLKIDCNVAENECNGTIVVLLNKSSNFYLLNEALNQQKDNN